MKYYNRGAACFAIHGMLECFNPNVVISSLIQSSYVSNFYKIRLCVYLYYAIFALFQDIFLEIDKFFLLKLDVLDLCIRNAKSHKVRIGMILERHNDCCNICESVTMHVLVVFIVYHEQVIKVSLLEQAIISKLPSV